MKEKSKKKRDTNVAIDGRVVMFIAIAWARMEKGNFMQEPSKIAGICEGKLSSLVVSFPPD